jgi:hypothetical protein
MEHRWGRRIPVDISVRLSCRPYAVGLGRMLDLSVSGAFIQTSLKLPLLARVHVEIEPPQGVGGQIHRVAACVVRRNANGFGLEWYELAPRTVREILVSGPRDLRLADGVSGREKTPAHALSAASWRQRSR